MAKITIGAGLWVTLYGYLNSMFTELYAAIMGRYSQTFTLIAGETILTTTLASEPYTLLILDSEGKSITHQIGIESMTLTGGVYVFIFYSSDTLTDVKLKITY